MPHFQKDLDGWNENKKVIDAKEIAYDFYFHERDVWWCALGVNVGVEADGKNDYFERPILILRKFNKQSFLGVALTSKSREGKFYHRVNHEKGCSWANLSQIRILSTKRLLRKVGMINAEDFVKIHQSLADLIKQSDSA